MFQLFLKEKSERNVDPWKGYLRLQKVKLKFSYDIYTAWQETESRILKKMNQGKFIKIKDGLWIHASRMQVQKLKGRRNQNQEPNFKVEKYKIAKQLDRLRKRYLRKPGNQDLLNWNKVMIIARSKFPDRYQKSWDEACDVSVRKMNRKVARNP
ncbi:hypothetical protein LFX25_03435 [Leptospira sp. FAT2]|uniref:hypothetical protein n=1 Tax=Leptospira sanjuanensis TaxID=2879643 RepID=UPI001EE8CB4C|nr:hypothetical protein [Leptospira sanjuanensis]MCG6192292.1 hypothetical protein [Leptospira sanjuanensis]